MKKFNQEAEKIMIERFGKNTVIALATVENGMPNVRYVNAYYENGVFYIITYALSNKIRQIQNNSGVAIAGEWFTAHGKGINLGYCTETRYLRKTGKGGTGRGKRRKACIFNGMGREADGKTERFINKLETRTSAVVGVLFLCPGAPGRPGHGGGTARRTNYPQHTKTPGKPRKNGNSGGFRI